MLRINLLSAFRHLMRNKLHSLANILGLTFSISVSLVLFCVISYELSFNKKIEDSDRIYRVYSSFSGTMNSLSRGVPTAISAEIKKELPDAQEVVLGCQYRATVTILDQSKQLELEKRNSLLITEPSYFRIFSNYQWIAGTPDVLKKPSQVVLTESSARLYFNSSDPSVVIGREVIYQDSISMSVAGIVKDLPFKTDLNFTDFISQETLHHKTLNRFLRLNDWNNVGAANFLFLKVNEKSSIKNVADYLDILSDKAEALRSNKNTRIDFKLDPLSNLHYNTDIGIFSYTRPAMELTTIRLLIIISILLLIVAIINYVNLETARAVVRAKEVGIRKIFGAKRFDLIVQFLTDSFTISLIATLLAYPLAKMIFYYFSEFMPEGMQISFVDSIYFLFTVMMSSAILCGIYPAAMQASFDPIECIKSEGNISIKKFGAIPIRKSLVVLQCAVAQFFIFYSIVFLAQMDFVLGNNLGFTKDGVFYMNIPWQEGGQKKHLLKNEIEKVSGVMQVSQSYEPPMQRGYRSSEVSFENNNRQVVVNVFKKFGDTNFLKLYEMDLIAGRNFIKSPSVTEIVVNETMVAEMGLISPLDAIGKVVEFDGIKVPIVGVIRDFNISSFHEKILPVMIGHDPDGYNCLNVKINISKENEQAHVMNQIESLWEKIYPNYPFQYEFLTVSISNLYGEEFKLQKLMSSVAVLAIFISCFGLFGMVSYSIATRYKEIAIRKLLGAPILKVVSLFWTEILIMVFIGAILSFPISWYFANQWLETFTYRISTEPLIFATTFIVMILVSGLAIGLKLIKSANSNIADMLRNNN